MGNSLNMQTIPALFLHRVTQEPHRIAAWAQAPKDDDQFFLDFIREVHDGPEGWIPATYDHMHKMVAGLAKRLQSLGVSRGVPVAILAETSERWALVDMAVQCLGGITVGIYPTLTDQDVHYQLEHSRASIVLVDSDVQAARCVAISDDLFDLQHIFSMHPSGVIPQLTPARPELQWLADQVDQVRAEDIATYIYTSGTTGEPKAVLLNHHNFTSIIRASTDRLPLEPEDRSVIFLPLAHVLQRFTQYRSLTESAVGWFAPSMEDLQATIQLARPHVMASVPRMLEKIRAEILARAEAEGPTATAALAWAIGVGRTRNAKKWAGDRIGLRIKAQHRLAEQLVFEKIREGLGGHLRLLICGGAPLDPELATWFEAVGISVREGWGLSETTAPVTVNGLDDFRFGSVGKPLDGNEITIADDGEVLVRGPGVFQGYLDDLDATADAFTLDGRFKTGDLGRIEDGFLHIIGRKKEILVTAGGKNIAPAPLESALQCAPIVTAVVIGDNRPYLGALLSLDPAAMAARAAAEGWEDDRKQWVRRPEVLTEVEAVVRRVNAERARFETIKRWRIVSEPISVDNGLLTPTLKLKRGAIAARFAEEIESLYA